MLGIAPSQSLEIVPDTILLPTISSAPVPVRNSSLNRLVERVDAGWALPQKALPWFMRLSQR